MPPVTMRAYSASLWTSCDEGRWFYRCIHALNVLRSDRNAADYNLTDSRLFTRDVVRVKIELAVEVVDRVNLCRSEPLRSRLHANIRQYAANVLQWPIA